MVDIIKIKENVIYLDENNFGRAIVNNNIIQNTKWLTFNPHHIEKKIDQEIDEIVEYIFHLRDINKDEEAVDFSDAFFQSFTGLMNILAKQQNFHQITTMWTWLIIKIKRIEDDRNIPFGKGVHKGTAFYFLGLSRLFMGDVDGAYLSFAEAEKEDEILPEVVLNRHKENLPPVVKILLLDLATDNYAYYYVKEIHDAIIIWEQNNPNICRSTSIFSSTKDALKKDILPRETVFHLYYALMKSYYINNKMKDFSRPTYLTTTLLCDLIIRFARTLEDFIRDAKKLKTNEKLFNYCHDVWFPSEKWSDGTISSYENNLDGLILDYINNKWNLSKDGRNLLFSLKIRNILAHHIQHDQIIFDSFIEIIMAISSSFGFVCDELSK